MNDVLGFIDSNREKNLNQLVELLSIPSISSQPASNADTRRCAEWVRDHLISIGIENSRIYETEGHPIVYGEWLKAGANAPTILVYGHYDVQPVDPLELWKNDPFKPLIQDGKIIARGSADDKGQFFCHIKSVEAFLKTKGTLPVNIKFIIEGEEEAAVSNLDEFIEKNAALLACDTVMVSDTEWFAEGLPTLCYSLRGISFAEVTVTGPNRDVHSGTFGGGIDNPANVLCWLITQLKDRYGRVTVPGFYDDVLDLTEDERAGFRELPFNEEEYRKDLDIRTTNGEIDYTTLERVWARPTLDINGMFSGYTGEGTKTIIPSTATVKISTRLVPNQNSHDIADKLEKYIKSLEPPTVKFKVEKMAGGNPILVEREGKGTRAAITALKTAFGKDPVFMREGWFDSNRRDIQQIPECPYNPHGFWFAERQYPFSKRELFN